jgi:hypothetical protein
MVTFLLFDKIFTDKIFTVTLSSYADCRTATMGRCPAYYFDQASVDTHPHLRSAMRRLGVPLCLEGKRQWCWRVRG